MKRFFCLIVLLVVCFYGVSKSLADINFVGKMAFSLKGAIYTMDHTGLKLVKEGDGYENPAVSPDGKRIAFVANDRGRTAIWVMNIDGSNPRPLTVGDPDGAEFDPAWSPDGKQIAFMSDMSDAGKNQDIYVINADGSGIKRLTDDPGYDDRPAWSPDGRRIAFSSMRDGNWEVYVMDADGKNQVNITKNPALDIEPAWSPDGLKIAFRSTRDSSNSIYVMNPDGAGLRRVTENIPAFMPVWSPDGLEIAFVSYPDPSTLPPFIMTVTINRKEYLVFRWGEYPDWVAGVPSVGTPVELRGKTPAVWGKLKK